MTLTAAWKEVKTSIEETGERRAVAALAASVALPSLDTESASQLAETEGLVTHLTSLVLVDEAVPFRMAFRQHERLRFQRLT